ncbi:hypothetical protein J6524_24575 [Bradyrhizobium sp. WSM 1738]|uniref:hypothetical protein n=1 Tax=Bradyrhizobium hereditatis TaxID=2821405 RepID=UPI001CE382BA|nr:hypothetical protein [Bradyrhizobium hereditatis]MCA6118027.1 hypothetical protein [Bradyrhizobium hereditatis]
MPEEGVKVHRFAVVLPKQLLTEASRHRDAVLPADQCAVMCCLGDDLTGLVHNVSHSPITLSGTTSAFSDQLAAFMSVPMPAMVRTQSSLVPSGCALQCMSFAHGRERTQFALAISA